MMSQIQRSCFAVKQTHLPVHFRPAEMSRGEWADVAVQTVFSREDVERLGDLFCQMAASAPAIWSCPVQLSAGGLADKGFDFPGAIGMDGSLQPIEKQFLELIRQA